MSEKKSKIPFLIIGLVMSIAGSISIYIFLQKKQVEFPLKKFILYLVIMCAILTTLGFIIWWIPSFFRKSNEQYLESPKEMVSSSRSIEIWREEFMKFNEIPFVTQTWNRNKIQIINENSIEIRHERCFVDPSGQTSDKFITFQANVRDGRRIGTMVAVLRIDLGEDWIRNNWNWRLNDNTTMNRFSMEIKKMPLTSAKESAERYNIKKLELLEEGYSRDEIKEMIDPFIPVKSISTPEPKSQSKEPIKTPELSDYNYNQDQDDDSQDEGELSEDIDNYRKKNV